MLACAVAIAGPWLLVDRLVLAVYPISLDLPQMRASLGMSLADSLVLIGDCTIAPMFRFPRVAGSVPVRVFGAGGTSVVEWKRLVENKLPEMAKARAVVVGSSHPFRFKAQVAKYNSYLPVIMSPLQILRYSLREGRIGLEEALQFELAKFFDSYQLSQTYRYRLMDRFLANFRAWYDFRNAMLAERDPWRLPKGNPASYILHDPEPGLDENEKALAGYSAALNHRLFFLLTPRETRQQSDEFRADRDAWLKDCRTMGVTCLDMSATMPDRDFFVGDSDGDGLHLGPPEALYRFLEKVAGATLGRDEKLRGMATVTPSSLRGR